MEILQNSLIFQQFITKYLIVKSLRKKGFIMEQTAYPHDAAEFLEKEYPPFSLAHCGKEEKGQLGTITAK